MKTILELPLIVQIILAIGVVAILIVVLLTQKGLVSQLLRKYLKLNTDDEVLLISDKLMKYELIAISEKQKKEILKKIKNELIGPRPDDR